MPGVATIPAYFKTGYMTQFFGFLVSILVSFVLGAVLTWIVGFKEDVREEMNEAEKKNEVSEVKSALDETKSLKLGSPAIGYAIPVTEVKDEAFASKMMGDGVGIIPESGNIYAPCDGTIEVVFPTGHAVGISSDDVEVLIHIGINTVELEGKGFKAHVEQGSTVKRGDLLVSFDKEYMEAEGYDSTVVFIVTEAGNKNVEILTGKDVDILETVIEVK